MDGVVADFDTKAEEIIGYQHPSHTRWPDEDWRKILDYPRFYRDLPLCEGALDLVTHALHIAHNNQMEVKFLTAIPKDNDFPWAFYDKVEWARKYFPMIPVFFGPYSHDKKHHVKTGDILIDDRITNIQDWNEAGGLGILHTGDIHATIRKLRDLI
jgi:5'(3')-deoxyribonucleotidase